MLASSILNSIMFKQLVGDFPNKWNTLHADRRQGNSRNIPYYQKWQKDHIVYLQFISDLEADIVLTAYNGLSVIATQTASYTTVYGTTDRRWFTNFVITLSSGYYEKVVYFTAEQSGVTLTSEPIVTTDLSYLIDLGVIKYIQYTNNDRIASDLDDRFIDWSALTSDGYFLDMYIEAVDFEPSDSDESEVLEGSQTKTIISASYFTGVSFKTGAIPDYLATKLGMITNLDIFMVNGLEYIKQGQIEQETFGGSTLYQASIKLSQKTAIGINVDNIGSIAAIIPEDETVLMYYGSVLLSPADETSVKAMTSATAVKADLTVLMELVSRKYCFAYPSIFGDLTSVTSYDDRDILSGFYKTTEIFTVGTGSVEYTIYTFSRPVTTPIDIDYYITFKF